MNYFFVFHLILCISYVHTQTFTEESPYMIMRLMDVRMNEWKPGMLDDLERVVDSELKYTDEKKGIECKSIDFEQQVGYPKQDARFLDLSIRGLCKDEHGKVHNIDKGLMIVAFERLLKKVNAVLPGPIYSVGHVQFYKRNRNTLNFIIIPIAVAFVLLLLGITLFLRHRRNQKKKDHIVTRLKENKEKNTKKAPKVANVNPDATEKQVLLQSDPTIAGRASDTLGSPKEFTTDQYPSTAHTKPTSTGFTRQSQGSSTVNDKPSQNQRSARSDREGRHVPYENVTKLISGQPQHESKFPDMIPLQEQPRVVVRTIRDDGGPSSYQEPSTNFVPIPVQVERSDPHQRFVPPPYHSDPYYRHVNA